MFLSSTSFCRSWWNSVFLPRFPWARRLRRRAGLSRARRPRRGPGRWLRGQNGRKVRAAFALAWLWDWQGLWEKGSLCVQAQLPWKYELQIGASGENHSVWLLSFVNVLDEALCKHRAAHRRHCRNVWLKGLFVIFFIWYLLRTFSFPSRNDFRNDQRNRPYWRPLWLFCLSSWCVW